MNIFGFEIPIFDILWSMFVIIVVVAYFYFRKIVVDFLECNEQLIKNVRNKRIQINQDNDY